MPSSSASALRPDRFSGNKNDFPIWKDKLLTYVRQLDQAYQREQLEKGFPDANVLMADFLEGTPARPVIGTDGGNQSRWERTHWERGDTDLRNLLNQVLPNSFISTLPDTVSNMECCQIWKLLEQEFGLGDAGGLIELTKQWRRLASSNWTDVRSLFAKFKKLRNDINRKTRVLIGQDMVTESWLCIEVLSQLPSEFWASSVSVTEEGFTIENIEMGLRKVFGDKSRKEIALHMEKKAPIAVNAVHSQASKKRKVEGEAPVKVECFYCEKEGHFKKDCPVRAKDRAAGIFRSNIKAEPSKRAPKTARVNVVKTEPTESQSTEESVPTSQGFPATTEEIEAATDATEVMGVVPVATATAASDEMTQSSSLDTYTPSDLFDKIMFDSNEDTTKGSDTFHHDGDVPMSEAGDLEEIEYQATP